MENSTFSLYLKKGSDEFNMIQKEFHFIFTILVENLKCSLNIQRIIF